MLLQQIVSGLASGSIYALVAIGLVLIATATHVVNFAQGEMAMFTTFMAFTLLVKLGLPYPVVVILTILIGGAMGWLVERTLLRPLTGAPHINSLILTLGLMLTLNDLAGLIWGRDPTGFPSPIREQSIVVSGLALSPLHLMIIGVTSLLLVGLWLFLTKTRQGTAMRATAQNMIAARLVGVSVERISSQTWMISAMIGALGGLLIAPIVFLENHMMLPILLRGFAGAVMGGFSNLPGAVTGAVLLGVGENLVGGYLSSKFQDSFAFLLIIMVLLIRPNGLFGTSRVKKV